MYWQYRGQYTTTAPAALVLWPIPRLAIARLAAATLGREVIEQSETGQKRPGMSGG